MVSKEINHLQRFVSNLGYLGGESRGGLVYAANALLNDWVPQSVLFARSDGFRIRAQKRQ